MGNSTQRTTTSSNTSSQNSPWGPSIPGLEKVISESDELFKSGVGSKVDTSSRVIPWSDRTTEGMNQALGFSRALQGDMAKPISAYSGMMDVLNPIAKGDFSNDTTFGSTLGRAQDDARDAVNLSLGPSGRFGSASHAGAVAKEIGDVTNRAMLDRQNWASGQMQNYGSAMPTAYATALAPTDTLMQIGSMDEDLARRVKDDEIRVFNESQNAPWDNLARYNAILSGAGQLGGTSNTSSTGSSTYPRQTPSFGQQLLGFGLSAASPFLGGVTK